MSMAHQPWTEELTPVDIPKDVTIKRMTVVERVYHQCGSHTAEKESRFDCPLESEEVSFQHPCAKAGPAWEELYTGYVEHVGTVVIENITGKHKATIPSEEQRRELATHKILLGVKVGEDIIDFDCIPPGQSRRLSPTKTLYLRSANGKAEYSSLVIPK